MFNLERTTLYYLVLANADVGVSLSNKCEALRAARVSVLWPRNYLRQSRKLFGEQARPFKTIFYIVTVIRKLLISCFVFVFFFNLRTLTYRLRSHRYKDCFNGGHLLAGLYVYVWSRINCRVGFFYWNLEMMAELWYRRFQIETRFGNVLISSAKICYNFIMWVDFNYDCFNNF